MHMRSLLEMKDGETGIVVNNLCSSSHTSRLAELGLADGEAVVMLQSGSPMLLQIGTSKVCLRSEDAATIAVLDL